MFLLLYLLSLLLFYCLSFVFSVSLFVGHIMKNILLGWLLMPIKVYIYKYIYMYLTNNRPRQKKHKKLHKKMRPHDQCTLYYSNFAFVIVKPYQKGETIPYIWLLHSSHPAVCLHTSTKLQKIRICRLQDSYIYPNVRTSYSNLICQLFFTLFPIIPSYFLLFISASSVSRTTLQNQQPYSYSSSSLQYTNLQTSSLIV